MSTKKLLAEVESDVLSLLRDNNVSLDIKRKVKAVFDKHAKAQDGLTIAMKRVASSNVAAIGYDPLTETLRVEFVSGSVYDYLKVPATVHANLMAAPSIGKFLNAEIKPNYGDLKIKA